MVTEQQAQDYLAGFLASHREVTIDIPLKCLPAFYAVVRTVKDAVMEEPPSVQQVINLWAPTAADAAEMAWDHEMDFRLTTMPEPLLVTYRTATEILELHCRRLTPERLRDDQVDGLDELQDTLGRVLDPDCLLRRFYTELLPDAP